MQNGGIAWGIGRDWPYWGLVITLILFVWVGVIFKRKHVGFEEVFILLGGLMNLIDRLDDGVIQDYWQFAPLKLWFNLADVLITIGVISYAAKNFIRRPGFDGDRQARGNGGKSSGDS